jgi:hypothetical protein
MLGILSVCSAPQAASGLQHLAQFVPDSDGLGVRFARLFAAAGLQERCIRQFAREQPPELVVGQRIEATGSAHGLAPPGRGRPLAGKYIDAKCGA